jgi:DNA-binding transcriptional LysR family regulator
MGKELQQWESRIGRRLKLRDLHVLSVVVQSGSMAKGARQLAMSQPAVSESIASLEATLGVRLLDRTTRGVEPTLYADALLKRGDVVFDELLQAIKSIEFLSNPNVGEIRVASGDTAAAGLLAPVIDRLLRRFPGITVRVTQASAEPMAYPELRERKVDLALARVSKSFSHSELEVELLFDDPPRVAVGTASTWARRRKVSLSDLADETWTLTSDQVIRDLINDAFRAAGLKEPRDAVSVSSMLLRSQLLATGRYVTVLPDSVLRSNAKQWSLKALPIDLGISAMAVTIVTLRNRTLSPVAQLFIEQVRAVAKTMSAHSHPA